MSVEESAPKRPKLTHEDETNRNPVAVVGPSNEKPQPPIFKLNIDCFDEIFEYLSIKDLNSFGQTCKSMQKVAGEYFKQNYSAAELFVEKDGVYIVRWDRNVRVIIPIFGFNQYITRIKQVTNYLNPFRYIRLHSKEFDSLKAIHFEELTVDEEKGEYLKEIWPKIETIHSTGCWIREDLFENVLNYCENLKHLRVVQNYSRYWLRFDRSDGVSWMHRTYPKLEYLEVIPAPSTDSLEVFFQNNPNVRSLSTNIPSIWYNRAGLMKSNIQLDLLEVKDARGTRFIHTSFFGLLKQLYDRGLFKRLHFYTHNFDENSCEQMSGLVALEMLCLSNLRKTFSLNRLVNLKELAIIKTGSRIDSSDVEALANSLVNLQRVYIKNAVIDDILPFIRRSLSVTKIKVIPKNDTDFCGAAGALKLQTMNKEREQLLGARKVTIYVPECIFLKTKWATSNGDMNLKLVEVARSDSYEWEQHYFA